MVLDIRRNEDVPETDDGRKTFDVIIRHDWTNRAVFHVCKLQAETIDQAVEIFAARLAAVVVSQPPRPWEL